MYYRMNWDEDAEFGFARSINKGKQLHLPEGRVESWEIPTLTLEGVLSDYMASDMGGRICSVKLKSILQDNAAETDELQWLPATILDGEMAHEFWILHFPNPPSVLNYDQSICVDDFVVKPVLHPTLVQGHHVFAFPKAGEGRLFISKEVKRAITKANCSGIAISTVPCR